MRSHVSWLLTVGLVTGSLIGSADVASADRHRGGYNNDQPREAPPAPRAERSTQRRGFVWIPGSWDWRGGRWEWLGGHYERERVGHRFREVRWERRGDVWVRIEGEWIDDGAPPPPPPPPTHADYPTSPPPAPPNDRLPQIGPDQVWIPGHYEWRNGRYQWHSGAIDRARHGSRFQPGSWTQHGDRYEFVEGQWVNDYPSSAPPSPREERIAARNGFVFIHGRWDWQGGQWVWIGGRWESERPTQTWTDGHWENRGGHWEWIDGTWGARAAEACPEHPPLNNPPPPNRVDQREPLAGHVVIPGHWTWQNCKYVWEASVYSQARPGYVFQDGRWIQNNGRWIRENGSWVKEPEPSGFSGPTSAPPPPRDEGYHSAKPGFVWIGGHYEWRNHEYQWVGGRWDRERPQKRWVDGRWELHGREWVFIEGSWQ